MQGKFRPRLTKEEYELIKNFRENNEPQVDEKNVKQKWLKTDNGTVHIINPDFSVDEFDFNSIDWDKILNPYIKYSDIESVDAKQEGFFDRLVYTDVHIGMNPNPDGYSLYGGKWDEEELNDCLDNTIKNVIANRKSDILMIDDLGDLMDGWDGMTERKGHKLPQNLTNTQAFDVALSFKVRMVKELKPYYDKIICHNVTNCNHSADFSYVVNSAFKKICESAFSNVEVVNYQKFIDHYQVGKYIFILCHGKDAGEMKYGLKPKIDNVGIEKIDQYINNYYLYNKGVEIEFSKGDSHQLLFDWSSSSKFNYFNYPAYSPSSTWVRMNYKKGDFGFVFFNYFEDSEPIIHNNKFEWKEA